MFAFPKITENCISLLQNFLVHGSYQVKKVSAIVSCKICNETKDENLFMNFIKLFVSLGKSQHCNERIAFLLIIENGLSYFSRNFYLTKFWPIISDLLTDKISNVKCFLLRILPCLLRRISSKEIENQVKERISSLMESKIKLEKEIADNINFELISLDMSANYNDMSNSEEQELIMHEKELFQKKEQVQ